MIQRIQSVFLLLVSLVMGTTTALPYFEEVNSRTTEDGKTHVATLNSLYMTHYIQDGDSQTIVEQDLTLSILVLGIVASLIALFSIFQYKNRMRQVKLSALNTLVIGGTAAAMFFYMYQAEELVDPVGKGTIMFGLYLPLVALVFNILARNFIMKDEKLVRSADRIR